MPLRLTRRRNASKKPASNRSTTHSAIRHHELTSLGWTDVFYDLRIDHDDDTGHPLYDTVEWTREQGEDILLSTPNPDEAAFWITEHIESLPD